MELLDRAHIEFMTADEANKYKQQMKNILKGHYLEKNNFDKITIGDFYSGRALLFWETERENCIEMITKTIKSNGVVSNNTLIGFIGAWLNSDIDHPLVSKLVKYCFKNNLLEYPINITVNEHMKLTEIKPKHRPKDHHYEYLDTLMNYFEIKTINGVAKSLKSNARTVRTHLNKLVDGEGKDHQKLIDENYIHYDHIKSIYGRWDEQRKSTR